MIIVSPCKNGKNVKVSFKTSQESAQEAMFIPKGLYEKHGLTESCRRMWRTCQEGMRDHWKRLGILSKTEHIEEDW
jgi:hypothetical protein